MPSETNHVCDVDTSLKVVGSEKFKHKGKSYTVRYGLPKSGKGGSRVYAMYYPKDQWTAAEARAHCKEHDGKKFEAAVQEFDAKKLFLPDPDDCGCDSEK